MEDLWERKTCGSCISWSGRSRFSQKSEEEKVKLGACFDWKSEEEFGDGKNHSACEEYAPYPVSLGVIV